MSLITNEQVSQIVIAYLATGKVPLFSNNEKEEAEAAGEWLGHMFNALKKTVNDEQGK